MEQSEHYYWTELYPNKLLGSSDCLFEVAKEGHREEYYLSQHEFPNYDQYLISNEDKFINKNVLSQSEMLRVVSDNHKEYWSRNITAETITPKKLKYEKRHTVYIQSDYKTVIRILTEILSRQRFYCLDLSQEDDLRLIEPSDFKGGNNKLNGFYFEVFMFRTEYKEGYSGCLISVKNIPLLISSLAELEEPINDWVIEKLEDVPCVITFDFPSVSYHFGTTSMDLFIKPFLFELSRNKIHAILFSVDDLVTYIKTNPFISNEERLEQLDINSGRIIDPKHNEKIVSDAQKVLGKYWDMLSATTTRVFPVGLELYGINLIYRNNILDSSPASIQFSKCVEIEIEQKLLLPFRELFLRDFINTDFSSDTSDNTLSKMIKFLINPKSKAPELGSFAFFLSTVIHSKARAATSPTITAYRRHVSSFVDSEFLISKEFYNMLNLISTKYRNGSAHTKALPFDYLQEFHETLIGVERKGFFFRLLDALKSD